MHRLDENFECSAMDAAKLWNIARHNKMSGCQLERYSVAILSNTTQDFFLPYLYAAGFACGLDLKIAWSGFDRIAEMVADPNSSLYAADPRVIFLNYNLEGKLAFTYHTTLTRNERLGAAKEFFREISLVVAYLRNNLPATKIIVHSFYWFHPPVLGFIDAVQSDGPSDVSNYMNNELYALAAAYSNVYVLDMQRVVAQVGFRHWRNNNRWFGEAVETINGNPILARECVKFVKSFTKRNRKVIVLDLDNTLWGGLAGEDGLAGIKLGNGYPGNVYKQFQHVLKLYSQRGVLLAINSKNNLDDGLNIIKNHPEMVLREEDFVAMRINWDDKIGNMQDIVLELNLNPNSLIFIDDSPQERDLIRHAMPEILVPEFPGQIADLPYLLDQLTDLDYDSFTETDRERTRMYRTESVRLEMKKEVTGLEDYLTMLEMQVVIRLAGEADLGRLEQMFQRTNQFNVTTKRYTIAELRLFATSPDHTLVLASMTDKFGDLGIVATAILTFDNKATIDSFLMTCRIIGKGVETAVLANLSKLALERGYRELYGAFVSTNKNQPGRDLYERHGFERRGREGDVEIFVLSDLADNSITVPDYIAVRH